MNATELARQAYAPSLLNLHSERRIESQVMGKITSRLSMAAKKKESEFPAFAEAIHENRNLWTTLAIDVVDGKNELPDLLRAQIFYLSEFVKSHGSKVLKGEESVTALIEINKAIMRGLNSEGSE